MKNILFAVIATVAIAAIGCGPSKEELAKKEKMKQDSIAAAVKADSIKKAEEEAAKPKDIVTTAMNAGSFKTLAALLTEAGLVDALKGAGPFTVFAPTDEAFAKVDAKALEGLKKDKAKLEKVLKYHVVSGMVKAADVKTDKVTTLSGSVAQTTAKDGKVMIDAANVTKADIVCSNGVIHVIDAVIMPKK
jgi:uncharacterized surface protein with fasciclin (FAS1) repeats